MSSTVLSGLALHCHHDKLAEWCWDYQERLEYIQTEKPEEERELRKALFQLIPIELLPAAFVKTHRDTLNLDALHRQICHPNCPWNGKTIFSRGKSIEALAGESYEP